MFFYIFLFLFLLILFINCMHSFFYTFLLSLSFTLPVLAAAPDMAILTLLQTLQHFIAPVDVLLKVICNSCVNNIYFQTVQYLTGSYSVSSKYLTILCTTGIYLICFICYESRTLFFVLRLFGYHYCFYIYLFLLLLLTFTCPRCSSRQLVDLSLSIYICILHIYPIFYLLIYHFLKMYVYCTILFLIKYFISSYTHSINTIFYSLFSALFFVFFYKHSHPLRFLYIFLSFFLSFSCPRCSSRQ